MEQKKGLKLPLGKNIILKTVITEIERNVNDI